jgi:hypothetical protein
MAHGIGSSLGLATNSLKSLSLPTLDPCLSPTLAKPRRISSKLRHIHRILLYLWIPIYFLISLILPVYLNSFPFPFLFLVFVT